MREDANETRKQIIQRAKEEMPRFKAYLRRNNLMVVGNKLVPKGSGEVFPFPPPVAAIAELDEDGLIRINDEVGRLEEVIRQKDEEIAEYADRCTRLEEENEKLRKRLIELAEIK